MNRPLHNKIEDKISTMIQEGDFKPGQRIGPETELAKKLSVSRSTLRIALGNLEEKGLIERIRGKGTFVSQNKKNLVNHDDIKHTNQINNTLLGMVVSYFRSSITPEFIRGANKAAEDLGYHLILKDSENDINKEKEVIDDLISGGVKGLVLYPANFEYYSPRILELNLEKFPLVMIGRHYKYLPISSIHADNYQGMRDAVNYLMSQGCSKLALISTKLTQISAIESRINGFKDECLQHHIDCFIDYLNLASNPAKADPTSANVMFPEQDKRDEEQVEKNIKHLENMLEKHPDIKGILTCHDVLALYVIKAARNIGMKVPEDLMVIGFDDAPFAAHVEPTISTVRVPRYEMAYKGVEILVEEIENKDTDLKNISLDTSLIIRDSVKKH